MLRNTFFLFMCLFIFSCKKNKETPADSCSVEITHQLTNPYTSPSGKLRMAHPSHQYVKFYLHNSKEYNTLEQQGVVLLDHPFDAVPDKNFQYTTEHSSTYGVYYGVVPYDVDISEFQSEKINDLYMSDENSTSRISAESSKQFSGTITFFDPIDSVQVPLQGVQVIIKDVTNIVYGITDSLGHFSFSSNRINSDTAEVLLKFDNNYLEIHTLDVGNIFGIFSINTYSLGFKKSCAFTNLDIEIGRQFSNAALHHSCAALHAMNKYKQFATTFGLQFPTKKSLFWLGKDAPISTSYATPMLNNMSMQNIDNPTQLISNLFGIDANMAQLLALIIGSRLPDLYAPYYSQYTTAARASFIETLFHEYSHAAHYDQVGSSFWIPYVEYIYAHGGYGEPSFTNSGIIGLSEAWAEDCSKIGLNYIYGKQRYLNQAETPATNWIPYGLYYDLYDTGTNESFDNVSGITFTQLYSFLQPDNRDLATLKARLKTAYPTQQTAIETLFNHYGY